MCLVDWFLDVFLSWYSPGKTKCNSHRAIDCVHEAAASGQDGSNVLASWATGENNANQWQQEPDRCLSGGFHFQSAPTSRYNGIHRSNRHNSPVQHAVGGNVSQRHLVLLTFLVWHLHTAFLRGKCWRQVISSKPGLPEAEAHPDAGFPVTAHWSHLPRAHPEAACTFPEPIATRVELSADCLQTVLPKRHQIKQND